MIKKLVEYERISNEEPMSCLKWRLGAHPHTGDVGCMGGCPTQLKCSDDGNSPSVSGRKNPHPHICIFSPLK